MRDKQKVIETVVKEIASAGDAEGGKEGLDGWDRPDLARPWPIRGDGRADCLRFASPAEALWERMPSDLKANIVGRQCFPTANFIPAANAIFTAAAAVRGH